MNQNAEIVTIMFLNFHISNQYKLLVTLAWESSNQYKEALGHQQELLLYQNSLASDITSCETSFGFVDIFGLLRCLTFELRSIGMWEGKKKRKGIS